MLWCTLQTLVTHADFDKMHVSECSATQHSSSIFSLSQSEQFFKFTIKRATGYLCLCGISWGPCPSIHSGTCMDRYSLHWTGYALLYWLVQGVFFFFGCVISKQEKSPLCACHILSILAWRRRIKLFSSYSVCFSEMQSGVCCSTALCNCLIALFVFMFLIPQ